MSVRRGRTRGAMFRCDDAMSIARDLRPSIGTRARLKLDPTSFDFAERADAAPHRKAQNALFSCGQERATRMNRQRPSIKLEPREAVFVKRIRASPPWWDAWRRSAAFKSRPRGRRAFDAAGGDLFNRRAARFRERSGGRARRV